MHTDILFITSFQQVFNIQNYIYSLYIIMLMIIVRQNQITFFKNNYTIYYLLQYCTYKHILFEQICY